MVIDERARRQAKRLGQAYLRSQGKWRGCDWVTAFGPRGLNLRGMSSHQASLLAGALAGEERQSWAEAAAWLREVEESAREAERHADAAVFLATFGRLEEALEYARLARFIEARYRPTSVWAPLCEALEEAGEPQEALAGCC